MSVFELDISDQDSAGADAIEIVNRRIIEKVAQRMKQKRITKSDLAARLGVHKSEISRILKGNQNITARKMGEIFWALDFDFRDLVLEDLLEEGANHLPSASFTLTQPVVVRDSQGASKVSNVVSQPNDVQHFFAMGRK